MAAPRNREIDFDFDFDSFVRAGEAKLCGCVREVPPQRWGCGCGEVLLRAAGSGVIFAAIHMGFKHF